MDFVVFCKKKRLRIFKKEKYNNRCIFMYDEIRKKSFYFYLFIKCSYIICCRNIYIFRKSVDLIFGED